MRSDAPEWVINPACERVAYRHHAILSLAAAAEAEATITCWQGYSPTPIHSLGALAGKLGVASIAYKDEGPRFGLRSFKALGGAYAVDRIVAARGRDGLTVACATDGNHGRAVAWGAARAGVRAVIYVHEQVSEGRAAAIAALGATVVRKGAHYDASVRAVAADAAANGWQIVSDTSWPGYTDVPRDIMQGYSLLALEAERQMPTPSHIFIQGGVGGVAAAIIAHAWERWGADRPRIIVVEPANAACLLASARAGQATAVHGDLDTIIAGLACGEPSLIAWDIVGPGADAFMTVSDDDARAAMRDLAELGIVGGESGVAGLAGCINAATVPDLRAALGLDSQSRVLCYGTEGATDPAVYAAIVGRSPDEVAA